MRHRSRNNAKNERFRWDLSISCASGGVLEEDVVTSTSSSDMVDSVNFGRPDSPVDHVRRTVFMAETLPVMTTPEYRYPGCIIELVPPTNFGLAHGFDPGTPGSVPDSYAKFVHHAGEAFQDHFRSTVSLANFLIELKDFKKLFSNISRHASGGLINRLYRIVNSEVKERVHSGPGSNYLDWVFNWKPLFEDIGKLSTSYQTCSKRLKFLLANSHFVDHARIRFTIEPESHGFDTVNYYSYVTPVGFAGFSYKIDLVPDWCQVMCCASAHVDNKINLDTLSAWDALADQLGLNNGPKVLWNATKLSWLVDFFLDSHDFFKAFEVQAGTGVLGIAGGTSSVKVTRQYKIVAKYSSPSGSIIEKEVGFVLYRTYRRDILAITPASLFSVNPELSVDQQMILGALAESQSSATQRAMKAWKYIFHRNMHTSGKNRWWRPKSH